MSGITRCLELPRFTLVMGQMRQKYYKTDDTEEVIGLYYRWDKSSDRLTLLMRQKWRLAYIADEKEFMTNDWLTLPMRKNSWRMIGLHCWWDRNRDWLTLLLRTKSWLMIGLHCWWDRNRDWLTLLLRTKSWLMIGLHCWWDGNKDWLTLLMRQKSWLTFGLHCWWDRSHD